MMQRDVKKFAARILISHLALLALVLAVVFVASRQVYNSAREQTLKQAEERQELLANQTARGIENFYDAILADLRLFSPQEGDEGDPDTRPSATAEPSAGFNLLRPPDAQRVGARSFAGRRGANLAVQLLTQQLQGRSHLFWIERQDEYWDSHPLNGAESSPMERDIIDQLHSWLTTIRKPTISGFYKPYPDQGGMNLVVAPAGRRGAISSLLVAAVGTRPIQREFLDQLSRNGAVNAYLFDQDMTVMAASQPDVVGVRTEMNEDPHLAPMIAGFRAAGYRGVGEMRKSFRIGSQHFAPSMLTAEPIQVLDKQWYLLVVSPLSDVDAIVRGLFKRAVFWAAFVAIAMAAILVSTAAQLIRGRMRLERERHEMLQSELHQARQIQLAWLPDKTRITASGLDIASINRPASHISGDFYNFFDLPDGRTAVVIGDVTGHGISAAFLMATAQLLVRSTLPRVLDPGRCLEEVNRQLCMQVFNGQFVTMLILVIDAAGRQIEAGIAGHPPPLLDEGQGLASVALEPQLVLGVERNATYRTQQFSIAPGSSLLLYTDGVVEAQNAAGQRLRLDGLRKALVGSDRSASTLVDATLAAVNSFRKGSELNDDLTLVAVHLQPSQSPSTQLAPLVPASI